MARATVLLIAMFCFLGEAKASDVGLYGTWLESVGDTKIEVIKALNSFLKDLKTAKTLVDNAAKEPCFVLEHVTQEDAQDCADALNAAGATAYVKLMHGKLLPYEYGFENNNLDEEGWSLVDCDVQTKPDTYDSHTGDYSFRFYSNNTSLNIRIIV